MKLSIKQRAALVRMLSYFWKPPRSDGRVQHGFNNTLWSLQDKGLVKFYRVGEKTPEGEEVQSPGWMLTDTGRELALQEKEAKDPKVLKESRK